VLNETPELIPSLSISFSCSAGTGVVVDEGLELDPQTFIDCFLDELHEFSQLARSLPM